MSNQYIKNPIPLGQRFWAKVDIKRPDECWPWKAGKRNNKGYGTFSVNGKPVLAHRMAYELHYGPLPEGHGACHHCDNPPCCNWHHLFAGTHQANMDDKAAKGRAIAKRGEENPKSKLTLVQVRKIRKLYATGNYSQTELGEMFGCSHSQVSHIVTFKHWN